MMKFFNRYSWQQKNRGLWWGALVFLFVVYQLSISNTWALRTAYRDATLALSASEQQAQQLAQLRTRAAQLIGKEHPADSTQHTAVDQWGTVAATAAQYDVLVKTVPQTQTAAADGLTVHYDQYGLTGSYDDLLQCWYELEKKGEMNIVHVAFKKVMNVQTKEAELNMYITTAYVIGD